MNVIPPLDFLGLANSNSLPTYSNKKETDFLEWNKFQ